MQNVRLASVFLGNQPKMLGLSHFPLIWNISMLLLNMPIDNFLSIGEEYKIKGRNN
jgi:hypothetical protein